MKGHQIITNSILREKKPLFNNLNTVCKLKSTFYTDKHIQNKIYDIRHATIIDTSINKLIKLSKTYNQKIYDKKSEKVQKRNYHMSLAKASIL